MITIVIKVEIDFSKHFDLQMALTAFSLWAQLYVMNNGQNVLWLKTLCIQMKNEYLIYFHYEKKKKKNFINQNVWIRLLNMYAKLMASALYSNTNNRSNIMKMLWIL